MEDALNLPGVVPFTLVKTRVKYGTVLNPHSDTIEGMSLFVPTSIWQAFSILFLLT